MLRVVAILAALAAVTGCASTATWQHPIRAGESHDGATMALAECESYAAGRTPMPTMMGYMPEPAPTSYHTTGTYTSYGNYGSFQGTTVASGGFASGYAAGANMGANIANAYALSAAHARQAELTTACMRTLGWIDTSTPEGQKKFKQAVAAQAAAERPAADQSQASMGREKWIATINAFVEAEAARPGGIDYRTDMAKQEALDKYVKQLANDPANDDRSMAWFLIEAHKIVLGER